MTESQIVAEGTKYWVLDTKHSYAVLKKECTHSVSDSEYERNEDGLSIALARFKYLEKRYGI